MDRNQSQPQTLNRYSVTTGFIHHMNSLHVSDLTWPHQLLLPVYHYPIATLQKWQTFPLPTAAPYVHYEMSHLTGRDGSVEWIYCLNAVPRVCALPLFPDLLSWWICMGRSLPQQQLVLGARETTEIRSIIGFVSTNPQYTPPTHTSCQGLSWNPPGENITSRRITNAWIQADDTGSHIVAATVTVFQLDDTLCWLGSVYRACGWRMDNCLLWEVKIYREETESVLKKDQLLKLWSACRKRSRRWYNQKCLISAVPNKI